MSDELVLPRSQALILTYLLNRGPARMWVIHANCRYYTRHTLHTGLNILKRCGLVRRVAHGIWEAV